MATTPGPTMRCSRGKSPTSSIVQLAGIGAQFARHDAGVAGHDIRTAECVSQVFSV